MNPQDEKTLTIARRTRENLEFIDAANADGKAVHEFTQLLNSMLGMVILLREGYFKDGSYTWGDAEEIGMDTSKITGKLREVSFSKLITNLRHAFAHNNFELVGEDKIIGLKVWNIPVGKTRRSESNWEADLTEEQLRAISGLCIKYIEKTVGGT